MGIDKELKTLHDNEDTIFGDAGDDALDGGAGIDYGLGGPDFDTCVNLEIVVNVRLEKGCSSPSFRM